MSLPQKTILTAIIVSLLAWHVECPTAIPTDNVTLALIVLAIVPWLSVFLEKAEVAGIKFEFHRLEKKTDALAAEVEKTRDRIERLLILSMSADALLQLEKLAGGNYGSFYRMEALTRELVYLANTGYISLRRMVRKDLSKDLMTFLGKRIALICPITLKSRQMDASTCN